MVLACGVLLGWLSVARHESYNTGYYDLGIMAQSVWTGTQGDMLDHTAPGIGPHSRMNIHVEWAYFLLVPFYALWPDPRLLLIVQAGLFVAGAWPLYRLALRRTDSIFAARSLVLIYLFYPTAQTSVLFDFHGDTLAMPILLFVLDALDARSWRWYAFFVVLALSCKFYVALPIAGIGAYLLVWGEDSAARRAGVASLVAGVGYGAIAFLVVRPLFAPEVVTEQITGGGFVAHYFGNTSELLATAGVRLVNALVVFGPVLLVAWRGWRWLLPGGPVALAMLLSTGPGGAYDFRYHHYALVVPFLVMAALEGVTILARQSAQRGRRAVRWRRDLGLTLFIVLLFHGLLVNTPLNPLAWKGVPERELDLSVYQVSPRDQMKDRFLQTEIPPRAALASSTFLSTHQVNRQTLYLVRYPFDPPTYPRVPEVAPLVDYVLVDALFDWYRPMGDGTFVGGATYDRQALHDALQQPGYGVVQARDGLVVLQRDAPAERVLLQEVAVESLSEATPPPPLARFGAAIELEAAQLAVVRPRRVRATFVWRAGPALASGADYVAVSRLEGVANARIVHIPTYVRYPTAQWEPGQRVRETFEVALPADMAAGRYTWRVGWYALEHPLSFATDARSRLSGSADVVVDSIELE
jgi:uncharacterized membrane protein